MPRQSVPKSLLDTVGALLDDKAYSDVEFVIPRRGQPMENARRIWASRRMLKRAEYFDTSMCVPPTMLCSRGVEPSLSTSVQLWFLRVTYRQQPANVASERSELLPRI